MKIHVLLMFVMFAPGSWARADKALTEVKFSQLLSAGWKDAGELAILVEALASQKQPDLALRCLQKAADADHLMPRRVMDASVNRHPNCELGNKLKELRDRIAPAKRQ